MHCHEFEGEEEEWSRCNLYHKFGESTKALSRKQLIYFYLEPCVINFPICFFMGYCKQQLMKFKSNFLVSDYF
nr:hypothetical protein [Mucilaginibacter sp. FT3.2]